MAGSAEEEALTRRKAEKVSGGAERDGPGCTGLRKKRRLSCLGLLVVSGAIIAVGSIFTPEPAPRVLSAQDVADRNQVIAYREAKAAMSDTNALMYCKSLVEKSAKWDYDWKSFTGIPDDVKYSRAMTTAGEIEVTVRGSGLKLQNGFGAWARHDFSCSFMAKTKKLTDLQIF